MVRRVAVVVCLALSSCLAPNPSWDGAGGSESASSGMTQATWDPGRSTLALFDAKTDSRLDWDGGPFTVAEGVELTMLIIPPDDAQVVQVEMSLVDRAADLLLLAATEVVPPWALFGDVDADLDACRETSCMADFGSGQYRLIATIYGADGGQTVEAYEIDLIYP